MYYDRKQRRNLRIRERDYAAGGVYYITICSYDHLELFGSIQDGEVCLSAAGIVIERQWMALQTSFETIRLDAYVIMPNHMHAIVVLDPFSERRITLGNVVRQFKAKSTTLVRQQLSDPEIRLWQRSYYDHIVRDGYDLDRIRQYIMNNPANWATDEYIPKQR